ncbi:glutaredoxin 3 [Legionella sp. CNM-4043-24]|uniref:glutaredoxin 3 n=1 Tax=Legionella sp. CNM-4043-24 TaxID=3421646 RepID=UPI00403B33D4
MARVLMYSTAYCPYCIRARALLDKKQVSYQDIRIDEHPEKRAEMMALSGRHTVPQIFINDEAIGGCDDLHALESTGQLDKLLSR